jgi:acetyl-CoA acetyltransferase
MRDVAVLGIGMHPWGKFPQKSFIDLGVTAIDNALKDASLEWKDVQSAVSGVWQWGGSEGITPGPFVNVAQRCATGGSVFRDAYFQVASGMYDVVLALGCDKSPKGFFSTPGKENSARYDCIDTDWIRWRMAGLTNPACWALDCRKRMDKYGTTESTLAKAKVACSKHGALNPNALYRKVYTEEEVLASPYVVDPLRLLMICATRDGAAAMILGSVEKARQLSTKLITVAGAAIGTSLYGDPTMRLGSSYVPIDSEVKAPPVSESASASRQAYEIAGIGPGDIDFLELPDNSSWHYLQYLEILGFCGPGEADQLLAEGHTLIGGKIPVCPSGGLASFGEASAAHGALQIFEVVTQLRGEAGERQVKGAKVGMAQTYGASGNSASVILKT